MLIRRIGRTFPKKQRRAQLPVRRIVIPVDDQRLFESLNKMHILLDRIDIAVHALFVEANDPDGRVQQAQNDALRSYGMVSQLGEMFGTYHDQMQAIAELLTLIYARLIEHDRRALEVSKNTLIIMQRQAERMRRQDELPDALTEAADVALAALHQEAAVARAMIDQEAQIARRLLERARQAATAHDAD